MLRRNILSGEGTVSIVSAVDSHHPVVRGSITRQYGTNSRRCRVGIAELMNERCVQGGPHLPGWAALRPSTVRPQHSTGATLLIASLTTYTYALSRQIVFIRCVYAFSTRKVMVTC
jgi:hypothetical protein